MNTKENRWTDDEIDLLKSLYPTASIKSLREAFPDRSPVALQHAATKIGVKRILAANGRTRLLDHLSETEKGYIAGIIDGEGCIHLARRGPFLHGTRMEKKSFSISVQVTNTDERLIRWLQEKVAGVGSVAVYENERLKSHRHRNIYQWTLRSAAGQLFLREIAPYLVIKREQAELLADGYKHLSESERDAVYESLRFLKRRGFSLSSHLLTKL